MSSILFRELETFKTPDNKEYEIRPIPTNKLEILWDYEDAVEKLKSKLPTGKKKPTDKQAREYIKNLSLKIFPESLKLIQASIFDTNDGKPLPDKYITTNNIMELSNRVIAATNGSQTDDVLDKGGDTPLEQAEEKPSD